MNQAPRRGAKKAHVPRPARPKRIALKGPKEISPGSRLPFAGDHPGVIPSRRSRTRGGNVGLFACTIAPDETSFDRLKLRTQANVLRCGSLADWLRNEECEVA